MRRARIVEEGAAYYHIMSRVVDRRFVFDEGDGRSLNVLDAPAGYGDPLIPSLDSLPYGTGSKRMATSWVVVLNPCHVQV